MTYVDIYVYIYEYILHAKFYGIYSKIVPVNRILKVLTLDRDMRSLLITVQAEQIAEEPSRCFQHANSTLHPQTYNLTCSLPLPSYLVN